MNPQPKRQLGYLTGFLAVVAATTAVSLVVGEVGSSPTAVPGVAAVETTVPTAAGSGTDSSAGETTTTATSATTTTTPAPVPLVIHTAADIEAAVAPKVAFVTTFNGSGSGVLVADDIVATNAHVVWPFQTVGVLFPGDSRRAGRVVGIDPRADVAFIQVESPRLPHPVPLGSTDELDEGASLFVVGYPAAEDFAPSPSVDSGPFRTVYEWEFSAASWVHSGSAAIGGQSGGALVDQYGRLVGITTFGSPSDLYSLSVEDLQERLASLAENGLGGIDDRRPPRTGGRRSHAVEFEGPWEQVAFVTWLAPGARSTLTSDRAVSWRALDPFGIELDAGRGALDVFWGLATPGVILGESASAATTDVEASRPLVTLEDPDDARWLEEGPDLAGFIDVPGDRDWFYLDVAEQDQITRVVVEAQTRVRIALFDRTTGAILADVVHERGFFFEDPALEFDALPAGEYVVTVEDVGAQFGMYRIDVE